MTAKKRTKSNRPKAFEKYGAVAFFRWLGQQEIDDELVTFAQATHVADELGLQLKPASIQTGLTDGRNEFWSEKQGVPELTKTEAKKVYAMVRRARKTLSASAA